MKLCAFLGVLLGLLGASVAAHAEGGTCPNGYYPVNSPGVMGCAPIPGYNQRQQAPPTPSPLWEDRWGAMATDEPRGILGSVTGLSSKVLAEQAAMADCKAKGGTNCTHQVAYVNGCAALVVGSKVFNVTADATAEKAAALGMNACSAEDSGCRVYYSACSPPARIR